MANDDKDLRLLFECDPVKNTECTKEGCYLFGGDYLKYMGGIEND